MRFFKVQNNYQYFPRDVFDMTTDPPTVTTPAAFKAKTVGQTVTNMVTELLAVTVSADDTAVDNWRTGQSALETANCDIISRSQFDAFADNCRQLIGAADPTRTDYRIIQDYVNSLT